MCVIKKLKQGKIKIKPREDKTEQQHRHPFMRVSAKKLLSFLALVKK